MYHYISRHPDSIAVSPELFTSHCETLSRAGWRGVGLDEAERYLLRGEMLPPKSCLITFDDGYLDNYVYAWPILQKYGHKGVIFAVSGRVENGDTLRPTLADVWDKTIEPTALPRVDAPFVRRSGGYEVREDPFINWGEAREMERSGVISLAAHTLSHRGVFINDDYDGFFLPGPRRRTFHTPEPFFWGLPRFVMGPGLLERAFLVDPELASRIRELVPQSEEEAFAFAACESNMRALRELVASYAGKLGRMEADDEMTERMRREIAWGKDILEKELGRKIMSLCWPWGACNDASLRIAQEAGLTVFFTTAMGANPPGMPLAVHRFKAKAKSASWLKNRVRLYSIPLLATLYAKAQIRSPGKRTKRKSFVIRHTQ